MSERPGNFFFRGAAVAITNVSVFESDGTFLAKMSSGTNLGFGKLATVKLAFASNGTYHLYVTAKFTVYMDMRIGFFPLETVTISAGAPLSLEPIKVS